MRGDIPPNWDERDAFSRWRHYLKRMNRPGARRKLKRRYHQRSRRTYRVEE